MWRSTTWQARGMCRSLLLWWETPLCLVAHGDGVAFLQSPGTRKRFMYNSTELDGQKMKNEKAPVYIGRNALPHFNVCVCMCVCVRVCACVRACVAISTTVFPKTIPRQHAGLHDILTREKRTRKVASCSASSWHLIKSRKNNVERETSLCGVRNKIKMTGECKTCTCTCINNTQVVGQKRHTDTLALSTGFAWHYRSLQPRWWSIGLIVNGGFMLLDAVCRKFSIIS